MLLNKTAISFLLFKTLSIWAKKFTLDPGHTFLWWWSKNVSIFSVLRDLQINLAQQKKISQGQHFIMLLKLIKVLSRECHNKPQSSCYIIPRAFFLYKVYTVSWTWFLQFLTFWVSLNYISLSPWDLHHMGSFFSVYVSICTDTAVAYSKSQQLLSNLIVVPFLQLW